MKTLIFVCLTAAIFDKMRNLIVKRRLLVATSKWRHQIVGEAAAAAVEALEDGQISLETYRHDLISV